MKIVVVGAGLLGSGIANRFALKGHAVTVLAPHSNSLLLPEVTFAHGRAELGSLLSDRLKGIDVVVDAASSYVPATVQDSPATAIASSVGVSGWIAEQAVREKVGCFIYLSSGGTVYGEGREPHHENERPDPISSYGALKVASEYAVAAITHQTATRAINLRVSNAYGPGQNLSRPQGIIGVAWRNHLQGLPTTIYGAKSTVRDFVYVDDVGDLCIRAAESGLRGPLNAGSGLGQSLSYVLAEMAVVSGVDLSVQHKGPRGFDVPVSTLDTRLARSLGWAPQVHLREGLERTWAWVRRAMA